MRDFIIKYLNTKIWFAVKDLKIDEFPEVKDLENFLSLLIDVQKELGPNEADELYRNRKLLMRINSKYKIIKDEILLVFIDYLRDLHIKSPSFSSNNYSFILGCIKTMLSKEEFLYDEYEKLSRKVKQKESENEDLTLHKMWLEELRNKVQNDMVITDEAFVDFILMDKYINNDYKLKLITGIERYNKNAIKKYIPASWEDVKKILGEYGYEIDSKDDLLKISANYKSLTLKSILETMKILKLNFDKDVLIKILTLGTSVNTIKEAYKKILNDKTYSLIATMKIHNFWIDKAYQNDVSVRSKSSIFSSNVVSSQSVKQESNYDYEDYELNSSEIFETASYLKKYPFYNSSFSGMKSVLKLPVEKLMKRENMFSLYGIDASDIDGSMALFTPYNITVLDQLIELDLKDYILDHLSTLSKPKSLPIVIYNKRSNNEVVTSIRNNNEYLIPDVVDGAINYADVINGSDLTELEIENRLEYDQRLKLNNPDKIIPAIYKNSIIKYLEENYRINDLQYKIGDYIFSRKKVLRVASSFDFKQKINLDLFLYIMTYQRIIGKKEANDLEELLSNVYELSNNYSL